MACASLALALVAIVACAATVLLSAWDGDSNWVRSRKLDGFCLAPNAQRRTRCPIESECWR